MPSPSAPAAPSAADPSVPLAGLPGGCYADPSLAERERAAVLLPSWQAVCHVSDLPAPGTAARCDFAGRTAVVLRGRDGTLHAYRNVCSHRGSRLVDGDPQTGFAFCVDARLRCPYHGWVYDDTGALVDVPRERSYPGLDRAALALRSLPVATWLGWVFVAFETPAGDLASQLESCTDELQPHRFESLRRCGEPRVRSVRADWKSACEQLLDSHHVTVARPALKPVVGHGREFAELGDAVLRTSIAITGEGASHWSARAYSRWLPEHSWLPDARRRHAYVYFIWPNTLLHVHPEQVLLEQVLPVAPGRAVLREVPYAVPDATRQMRLARYAARRVQRAARRDDVRLMERLQAGRESGDGLAAGPIAADEAGLRWFTRRFLTAVPEAGGGRPRAPRARRSPRRQT